MAITADVSDPLDDTKGGDSIWGHWQQDKKDQVVLTLIPPVGANPRNIRVSITSSSIKVMFMGETRMDGELFGKVRAQRICRWSSVRRWVVHH